MGSVPNDLEAAFTQEIRFFAVTDTQYLIFYSVREGGPIEIVRVFSARLAYTREFS